MPNIVWKGAVISNIACEPYKRSQSELVVDVRKTLRSIWSQANQLGNDDQTDKAAKYHNWVALPLRSVTVDGLPFSVPGYLHGFGQAITAHVSGYIPIRCESRQEAGDIMMVPVICGLQAI